MIDVLRLFPSWTWHRSRAAIEAFSDRGLAFFSPFSLQISFGWNTEIIILQPKSELVILLALCFVDLGSSDYDLKWCDVFGHVNFVSCHKIDIDPCYDGYGAPKSEFGKHGHE